MCLCAFSVIFPLTLHFFLLPQLLDVRLTLSGVWSVSIKGISGNNNLTHFDLYDQDRRGHLLQSLIGRLPTDVQRDFIIDEYTDEPIDEDYYNDEFDYD